MLGIRKYQQVWYITLCVFGQENETRINEELAQESHKPVTKKFKRRKVYARFKCNIWAADLADLRLLVKNLTLKYLLCAINVFTKYISVKLLKYEKGITVPTAAIKQ